MSIHMNDNGITSDFQFMLDILDIFGIGQNDLPPDRLFHDHKDFKPKTKKPMSQHKCNNQ